MMTYLSQYPNAKLKQGAPIRSKTNPSRYIYLYSYCELLRCLNCSLNYLYIYIYLYTLFSVRVYGPGIEPTGPSVGAKTQFTVETFSAGKGKVDVLIENPKGKAEPVCTTHVYTLRIIFKTKVFFFRLILFLITIEVKRIQLLTNQLSKGRIKYTSISPACRPQNLPTKST